MKISFIHSGNEQMASYRYRGQIPASFIGEMNNLDADVLVFIKPIGAEVEIARTEQERGATIIVDFCDDHFDEPHYHEMASFADAVTCPTEAMAKLILGKTGIEATVIADPYEFDQKEPHCNGANLLWFGHGSNWPSLERILPRLMMPMRAVSNIPLAMPWSMQTMLEEFARADIVLMPATKGYKSPNRTIESIRQGCFVVAEPHPSLKDFPIWQGDIIEGVQWAIQNPQLANDMTRKAQAWVQRYSPRTLADAWKTLCWKARLACTSGRGKSDGLNGSTSISTTPMPM